MKYPVRKSLLDHKLKSYVHSDLEIPGNSIDCSLGINPFGYTPTITEDVFLSTFKTISSYPSYPYNSLREAVVRYLSPLAQISPEQLGFQAGSISMIVDLNRLFIEDGTGILAGAPSFSSALTDMKGMGGKIDFINLREEENFKFSVNAYIEAISEEHSIVYIDNPNNPTGQIIPIVELEKLAKICLKKDSVLIIDEAYGEFMDFENSAVSLVNAYDNVIVLKTFSKGHGLAGLRAGYTIVPKAFVKYLKKLPAEMALTEIAATLCPYALADKKHLLDSRKKIASNKKTLLNSLRVLKHSYTDLTVPITLLYTDKDVDLFSIFLNNGILTERGEDFDGIGRRHIRMRVPSDLQELLKRLELVERELYKS